MKRSEMIEKIDEKFEELFLSGELSKPLGAHILDLIEEVGMLPPRRDDESPNGYGAAYLSEEEVAQRYFKFKHSWEEEDAD